MFLYSILLCVYYCCDILRSHNLFLYISVFKRAWNFTYEVFSVGVSIEFGWFTTYFVLLHTRPNLKNSFLWQHCIIYENTLYMNYLKKLHLPNLEGFETI